MKVCVYGTGAIGGFIGARLAHSGHTVTAVAHGATLAALRRSGLRLVQGGETIVAPIAAEEDPARLGPQDLVIVAVKAPALGAVATRIGPLLGPQTAVLVAMNGVPWWFFEGIAGPHAGTHLASVDPDGAIATAIPVRHVVGCVVHASCSTPEPGLVRHGMGNGLIIGEPAGGRSARVERLAAELELAGFAATVSERIQKDIWYKLWGNMTMNPVSALTGATADRILDDPLVREFMVRAMGEAAAIGERIDCGIGESAEARIAVTRKLGAFKTSMLQDVEAGKPIELDALMTVVREIGAKVGVQTPNIDALLGLARLFGQVRGLYPQGPTR
jgi:2-dehydropantoate 2-reductase